MNSYNFTNLYRGILRYKILDYLTQAVLSQNPEPSIKYGKLKEDKVDQTSKQVLYVLNICFTSNLR